MVMQLSVLFFSEIFTEDAWMRTHALAARLKEDNYQWLLSIIPTYTTVIIHYNIILIDKEAVTQIIRETINKLDPELKVQKKEIHIFFLLFMEENSVLTYRRLQKGYI